MSTVINVAAFAFFDVAFELKIGGWSLLIFELTLKKKQEKKTGEKIPFGNCIEGHSSHISRRAELH